MRWRWFCCLSLMLLFLNFRCADESADNRNVRAITPRAEYKIVFILYSLFFEICICPGINKTRVLKLWPKKNGTATKAVPLRFRGEPGEINSYGSSTESSTRYDRRGGSVSDSVF